jgi:hypothetical protein
MHVHHVNDELNDHTVKFIGRRAGIPWTIGIEDCWHPFQFFADSLPSVTTLHLGEKTALYAFTNAVGEHGRSALAAAQHVLVKNTRTDFSYLLSRQWLHLRISIGRRVHTIELCKDSPVHPDPWSSAAIKWDVTQMKLTDIFIHEDGVTCVLAPWLATSASLAPGRTAAGEAEIDSMK